MKTDAITTSTTKSLSEISNGIRQAASKLRAEMCNPTVSPFGDVGFTKADLSVALYGHNSILGGPRHWGVQVIVIDNGDKRNIELVAVGDDTLNKIRFGSFGGPFFQLGDSIDRRDTIKEMII